MHFNPLLCGLYNDIITEFVPGFKPCTFLNLQTSFYGYYYDALQSQFTKILISLNFLFTSCFIFKLKVAEMNIFFGIFAGVDHLQLHFWGPRVPL